jgi:hypothetical protein
MMRWCGFPWLRVAACIAVCSLGAVPVAAQETVNFASVSGRVTDTTGAVVAGVRVTARQTETNVSVSVETARDGRYRFSYLRVGPYEITAAMPGFAVTARSLTVTIGAAFDVPLVLAPATVDTSVDVVGQSAVLESARSQIAGTVQQAEIRSLPMNGRNFLDLAMLIPGVSPANNGPTQLFAETSAVSGTGLSVASQRNFSNNFIVDGLSANDDAAGVSGMPYGVDAVDQFQVVTSGGQAEFGRALGGYVNVVTRSGTDLVHGTGYGYFRDSRLNAVNALSGTRLPMSQQQYGASLGGPLRKHQTFYFANVEARRLEQTGLTTISDANIAAITGRLSAAGYRGAAVTTGEYDTPVHSFNALSKIDHQVRGRDSLGLRYSVYHVTSDNSRGAGGLNAPSASAALRDTDQAIAFSNTLTFSSQTVLETRAQWASGRLTAPPTDQIGPAVTISGVAVFGTSSGAPTARTNTSLQIVNNLSHQAGAHGLRAGVDALFNNDTITYPRSNRGAYTFQTLAAFLAGTYTATGFTQTFGDSVVSQSNPNVGIYLQDEWKAAPALTINAGIRYDLQLLETISTDTNNLSPRAGFAWTPFSSRRTVIRGNAGVYYDRIPLRPLANALLSAGNTTDLANLRQISVTLAPAQSGAPVFPNVLAAAATSVTLPSLTTMDRHIQNAHASQFSLEVEQLLGAGATVGVSYQYMRGRNLLVSLNQNVPTCAAAGANNGCRPVSAYANNSQYSSSAASDYRGLQISLTQRPSGWAHYRVSYALSTSMNNVGENFFSSPIDPTDISKDWARSDDDQRHRLVVSGGIDYRGWSLSSVAQYSSALPVNITSGVTTIQATAGRPVVNGAFITRNAGVGDDTFLWNARLTKSASLGGRARIEAGAEVFNLTKRRNDIARNTTFGAGAYPSNPSPSFNQITAVGEPRSFQLVLRVVF